MSFASRPFPNGRSKSNPSPSSSESEGSGYAPDDDTSSDEKWTDGRQSNQGQSDDDERVSESGDLMDWSSADDEDEDESEDMVCLVSTFLNNVSSFSYLSPSTQSEEDTDNMKESDVEEDNKDKQDS